MAYSKQYLEDTECLCQYCQWTDYGSRDTPPVYCVGGKPIMCEGSYCDDAYQYYLDNYACDTDIDNEE